jgi:hypothetical protein
MLKIGWAITSAQIGLNRPADNSADKHKSHGLETAESNVAYG